MLSVLQLDQRLSSNPQIAPSWKTMEVSGGRRQRNDSIHLPAPSGYGGPSHAVMKPVCMPRYYQTVGMGITSYDCIRTGCKVASPLDIWLEPEDGTCTGLHLGLSATYTMYIVNKQFVLQLSLAGICAVPPAKWMPSLPPTTIQSCSPSALSSTP
jgi:hypothetical protein